MTQDAVWLDVLPSMANFTDKLTKGADEASDKAGKSAGRKFGLAAAAGVAAVAGGVVLAGKALYDLGSTFDGMADTIRVGTGATGDALDALVASAKTVGNTVPASFEDIGTVVADVNTRLGLTGATLETFSGQVLEAGRLTGEAIDVNKISAAFSVFKVEGEASVGAMDTLFRVSQDTGVGMNQLASVVQKAGPAVQALGFDFDQTAALVGGLDKAGLDASRMTAGLSRSLAELAKDGEEPAAAFQRVTGEIQAMAEAGDVVGATDMAAKLFGTKNAPAFVQALKDGTLNLEDLTAAAVGSGDTIMAASKDTADFSEQWQLFQNRMSVLVAPAAEKVFGLIGTGMQWINDVAVPAVQAFMAEWESGAGTLGTVQTVLADAEAFIRANVLPVLFQVGEWIRDYVVPYVAQLVALVVDNVIPMAQGWWAVFQEKVLPVLQDVAAFILEKVVPAVQGFLDKATPAFQNIATLVSEVFTGVVLPILGLVWDFIRNVLGPIFSWLWDKVVSPILSNMGTGFQVFSDVALGVFRGVRDFLQDVLGPAFQRFGEGVADVWEGLQRAIAVPVNFIIGTVWNNGLRKALNLIPGVDLREARLVSVPSAGTGRGSTGGATAARAFYAGGFTGPGNWWDPAGVVHAGEYVFTKAEVDRMGGWEALEAWKHTLPGYAGGGRVQWRGKTFTERFAANLAAAEAMSRSRFNVSQGGFRPRTSYSGTSHQADAVDILGPITTAVITALRANGVAAWDRTGKGNWAPHIHGVPLPGYGTAGGSAIWQAQDYLRGGDGLGGRDNGPRVAAGGGGLFAIPGMIADALEAVREGLTGPWGDLMREGLVGVVSGIKDWALGQLNGWGQALGTMIFGAPEAARGYAGGTGWAQPGWADLGELGAPELVIGRRYMQGGESVLGGAATRALLSRQDAPAGEYVTAQDIADALLLAGFPERVREGVARGLADRGRTLLVEDMEG